MLCLFELDEIKNIPPVKELLIQSMIDVRFRTLLYELQGNSTALKSNHTALAERVSTMEEFLPPRMALVDGHSRLKSSR